MYLLLLLLLFVFSVVVIDIVAVLRLVSFFVAVISPFLLNSDVAAVDVLVDIAAAVVVDQILIFCLLLLLRPMLYCRCTLDCT